MKFAFPLDPHWGIQPWYVRLCARIVARMILRSKGQTYQFGGWTGTKKLSYEMVDADKFQLVHWILREAGYSCSPADVMEVCGVDCSSRREARQLQAL